MAPAPFKGRFTAHAVADAMAAGVTAADPGCRVVAVPLADGGEGTGAAVAQAWRLTAQSVVAHDPLGRLVEAHWWRGAGGGSALVESAVAAGLPLLAAAERDPARVNSAGLADVIRAVAAAGAVEVVLAVGGTATVDGAAGLLRALGAQLRDPAGRVVEAANPVLAAGAVLDLSGLDPAVRRLRWRLWLDVEAPLVGPEGAAHAFGPQKGAAPALVEALEAGLGRWAALLARATGRDPRRGPPGMGAGGGLAAGIWSVFGARCEPGAEAVCRAAGLRSRLQGAALLLTGEGRLDRTTRQGKAPLAAARVATAMGIPTAWVVGSAEPGTAPPGGGRVWPAAAAGAMASLADVRRAGAAAVRALAP